MANSPELVKPVPIMSDDPVCIDPKFGFDAYARTLAGLIANKYNSTPLVIGVYGHWGTGKTSLMKTVQAYLSKPDIMETEGLRPCKTVWFQAWKYSEQNEILAALIRVVLEAIKEDTNFIRRLNGEIEKAVGKIQPLKGALELLKSFTGADIGKFLSDLPHEGQLSFYDRFNDFFERLVWTYTRLRPKFFGKEEPDDEKGALVVFIDDLDRCPGPRIVKVLETIKLFMDQKGCVFVIGAAEEIIETAIQEHGFGESARQFMDKIVRVTFRLPEPEKDDFCGILPENAKNNEAIKHNLSVIVPTVEKNPRRFKRFLNDLALLEALHSNKNTGVEYQDLIYWKLIEFESPRFVILVKENSANFNIMKEIVDKNAEIDSSDDRWHIPHEKLKKVMENSLVEFLQKQNLVHLIKESTLDKKKVVAMVSLSAIVPSEVELEIKTPSEPGRFMKASAKPGMAAETVIRPEAPSYPGGRIEMVPIGAGEFKYQDGEGKIEKAFEIGIYPVTNYQFNEFVAANMYAIDGEEGEKIWTKDGLEWRKRNRITQPGYWESEKWNRSDHPVVGVSWYEANAF